MDLHCEHAAWKDTQRRRYGALVKVFITESRKKAGAELINLVGSDSLLSGKGLGTVEGGWSPSLASTIYGGTTQVHPSWQRRGWACRVRDLRAR